MNEQTNGATIYTHRAILGGDETMLNASCMTAIIDALMAKHPGAGAPTIVALSPAAPSFSSFGPGNQIVDDRAEARISGMHAALQKAGVAVDTDRQLYATGTRMAREGYENQEARRDEHDGQLALVDAASRLRDLVKQERREDAVLMAGELARTITVNGKVKGAGFVLTEDAIQGLLGRLEARGAWGYAQGLKARIVAEVAKGDAADRRAIDSDKAKLADLLTHECRRNPFVELKLRGRRAMGDCYAIVSPSYVAADADAVVEQIVGLMPDGARGSFSYDARSTSWELRGEIWTPTPVAEQAVGEPFKGFVSFTSEDNGRGRLSGGGGVELLACLNAGTYVAQGADASRIHRGKIAIDLDRMLAAALRSIDTLCEAWGVNRAYDLRADMAALEGVPVSKAIPGLWWGELTDRGSELAVLPGRTAKHVEGLTAAYYAERRDSDRIVRADFAQAYTKYIQEQPAPVRREAEAAVGSWLARPRPMRFDSSRLG